MGSEGVRRLEIPVQFEEELRRGEASVKELDPGQHFFPRYVSALHMSRQHHSQSFKRLLARGDSVPPSEVVSRSQTLFHNLRMLHRVWNYSSHWLSMGASISVHKKYILKYLYILF